MDQKMLKSKRRMSDELGNELKIFSVKERKYDRN
jgi:hypothetical protein